MHDWLLETWYGSGRRGRWLRPLAWLFAGLVALRRGAYRHGFLPRYRSRRPIVVVGNLSVGGTGKTPLLIWLAGELATRGLRVGVASRGYGGAGGRARCLGDGDDATQAGDEAVLLRRRLRVPVATGRRRPEAVKLLEPACDLILCDDGLQHYALERDFEIALVDGTRGLGNGWLLPAGPLREPPGRLGEVDAVVVNGPGFQWPGALRMRLDPVAVVALADRERRPLSGFAGREVHAFAAIGNPQQFFAMLRQHGLQVHEHPLPDHAPIAPGMVNGDDGYPVLMTEKDAVKCGPGLRNAWYVEIAASIDGPGASGLADRIAGLARPRHEGPTSRG